MVDDPAERLWGGPSPVRAFLSHTAEFKAEAAKIKIGLSWYGIAGFLAHEDITPTSEWQEEILFALQTMDLMIPLLTRTFQESQWTGQEIGYGFARQKPFIPVRLGSDPYGFIGKYQALNYSGDTYSDLGRSIFELMLDREGADLRELAKDAFVYAVSNARSFDIANELALWLPKIKDLSDEQVTSLIQAFNNNSQVGGAYDFQNALPPYLTEVTGTLFMLSNGPDGEPKI